MLTGYLNDIFEIYFQMNANYFLVGRFKAFEIAFNINSYDILDNFMVIGSGLGSLNLALIESYYTNIKLVHSDVIKIFVEGGYILFAYYFYKFYSISSRYFYSSLLLIFLNILFFTDNVIIYYSVLFTFYFSQIHFKKS